MEKVCQKDSTLLDMCEKNYKQKTGPTKAKSEFITQWINSSDFDDDSESIVSDSTAVSSSVVDSEDHGFDITSLSLEDSSNSGKMSSRSFTNNTNGSSNVDVLQNIFNKDSNVQTVGNVHIENSSQVHIGNVTYITGPIHISSSSGMELLFNNNSRTIHTDAPLPNRSSKVPTAQKEEEFSEREEANRDDAFLGNIKRKVAETVLRIVDRRQWVAQKPMEPYDFINEPVEYVIISHSATDMATTQAENIYIIRNIQTFHVESRRWNDISYNFMIGGDGNVYQGRGWGVVGAHTKGYNICSLGICFIGCFMRELPPEVSLKACQMIIKKGVEGGFIDKNYKLVGHCQCSPTESPGRKLFEEIKTWGHYSEFV